MVLEFRVGLSEQTVVRRTDRNRPVGHNSGLLHKMGAIPEAENSLAMTFVVLETCCSHTVVSERPEATACFLQKHSLEQTTDHYPALVRAPGMLYTVTDACFEVVEAAHD